MLILVLWKQTGITRLNVSYLAVSPPLIMFYYSDYGLDNQVAVPGRSREFIATTSRSAVGPTSSHIK